MQAWSAARVSIGVPVQREQREHSAGAVRTLAFGLDSPAQSPQRLAECPPVVAHHSLSSQLRPQTSSSDQRVVTGLRAPHPKEVSLSLSWTRHIASSPSRCCRPARLATARPSPSLSPSPFPLARTHTVHFLRPEPAPPASPSLATLRSRPSQVSPFSTSSPPARPSAACLEACCPGAWPWAHRNHGCRQLRRAPLEESR